MSQFDQYKDSYIKSVEASVSFAGKNHRFFTEVKARELLNSVARLRGTTQGLSILDVGCGPGATDEFLTGRFAKVSGVDVSEGILETARKKNPAATYAFYDGTRLPFADATFDVAFTICVMHHVPPEHWTAFVAEMKRVTKPGGLCYVFEHNPLNPLTRKAVHDCEFDQDAVLLRRARVRELFNGAGLRVVEQRYILFAPIEGEWVREVESWLRWLPLGAQYYVCGELGSSKKQA